MPYVADLHIHSKYAGACSRDLNIPNLSTWAKYKGINLVGTGDALHLLYQQELKRDLTDSGGGIYENNGTKFLITAEVSCIYSEGGKTRRIHLILLFPSLDCAFNLSQALLKKGAKLASDGRPILGMSAKQICDSALSIDPNILIIPAHVWTPWFSLYGSNSGFDSIKDCFGDFSDSIFAVETGLSSQPAMNWRIGDLDNKAIVSFSDLHSLPRLGRECTIFAGKISFQNLKTDLINQNIIATIEFFPEEGKYHYSGHRSCGVVYDPKTLKAKGEICPKCGKRLTIGVLQRIEDLATRSEEDLSLEKQAGVIKSKAFPKRPQFRMLIQLEEIIAESLNSTVKSQKVQDIYQKMVSQIDPELKILTKTPLDLISMAVGEKIAEGINRVREGKLSIEPGFDNTYGIVKIWDEDEKKVEDDSQEQISLFK